MIMETGEMIEQLRKISEATHEPVLFIVIHPKAACVISNCGEMMSQYPELAKMMDRAFHSYLRDMLYPVTNQN